MDGVPANNIARWGDCHHCLADLNSDDQVGIDDLVAVITAWGDCPPQPQWCSADIAPNIIGDNVVNMDDLTAIFQGWGPHGVGYDIDDLVNVITSWGPCPAKPPPPVCQADITRSGAVDIDDLVAVITAWGPCPN